MIQNVRYHQSIACSLWALHYVILAVSELYFLSLKYSQEPS